MLYRELTYQDVREQNLRVMDPTAIAQCMEHDMPILVFNYREGRQHRTGRPRRRHRHARSQPAGKEISLEMQ